MCIQGRHTSPNGLQGPECVPYLNSRKADSTLSLTIKQHSLKTEVNQAGEKCPVKTTPVWIPVIRERQFALQQNKTNKKKALVTLFI